MALEWVFDTSVFDEPEPKPKTDEVVYVYVKGQGWVPEKPENRAQAKPSNFGYAWGTPATWVAPIAPDDPDMLRYMQRVREEQQRIRRQRDEEDYQRMRRRLENPDAVEEQRLFTYDTGYNYIARWVNETPMRQIPRNPRRERTTDELAEQTGVRYFPGSGVRAEPARQENTHERRAREYQEARERVRRRRGR